MSRPSTRPIPEDARRCIAFTKAGARCSNPFVHGAEDRLCTAHSGVLQEASRVRVEIQHDDRVAAALIRQEDREAWAQHRRERHEAPEMDPEIARLLEEKNAPREPVEKTQDEIDAVRASLRTGYPSEMTRPGSPFDAIVAYVTERQRMNQETRDSWIAAHGSSMGIHRPDIPPPPRLVLPFPELDLLDPVKAAAACMTYLGGQLPTLQRMRDANDRHEEGIEARDDLIQGDLPFPAAGFHDDSPYAPKSKTRFYSPLDPRARKAAREARAHEMPGYSRW